MTPEQYLDAHPAEVFAKIAEAMGRLPFPPTKGSNVCTCSEHKDGSGAIYYYNPINNAEQRWELAVFLYKYNDSEGQQSFCTEIDLFNVWLSDNPPRELVLVAMEMLGIRDKGE